VDVAIIIPLETTIIQQPVNSLSFRVGGGGRRRGRRRKRRRARTRRKKRKEKS
jgi:hypothetical protein